MSAPGAQTARRHLALDPPLDAPGIEPHAHRQLRAVVLEDRIDSRIIGGQRGLRERTVQPVRERSRFAVRQGEHAELILDVGVEARLQTRRVEQPRAVPGPQEHGLVGREKLRHLARGRTRPGLDEIERQLSRPVAVAIREERDGLAVGREHGRGVVAALVRGQRRHLLGSHVQQIELRPIRIAQVAEAILLEVQPIDHDGLRRLGLVGGLLLGRHRKYQPLPVRCPRIIADLAGRLGQGLSIAAAKVQHVDLRLDACPCRQEGEAAAVGAELRGSQRDGGRGEAQVFRAVEAHHPQAALALIGIPRGPLDRVGDPAAVARAGKTVDRQQPVEIVQLEGALLGGGRANRGQDKTRDAQTPDDSGHDPLVEVVLRVGYHRHLGQKVRECRKLPRAADTQIHRRGGMTDISWCCSRTCSRG